MVNRTVIIVTKNRSTQIALNALLERAFGFGHLVILEYAFYVMITRMDEFPTATKMFKHKNILRAKKYTKNLKGLFLVIKKGHFQHNVCLIDKYLSTLQKQHVVVL